jgi:glycopeptide antibiotics resistance protein
MIRLFEKYSKVSWLFVILIAVAIFCISSLSSEEVAPVVGFSWQPTAYHILAFFFLAFFLLPALVKGENQKLIFLAIILAVLYGISDEFHQLFVPGRTGSFSDLLLNLFGILSASLIYTVSLKRRKTIKAI